LIGVSERNRRGTDDILLPIYLESDECTVAEADGETFGFGFKPYLDRERTVELNENDVSPVLPGVFFTRVAGVAFHDDVLQLPHFGAGKLVEIRPEPANPADRNALAVMGGGLRVGFLPAPICEVLAPAGTRIGRGMVLKEWSVNGVRRDIWILGSMHVNLSIAMGDDPVAD
jgi:hypothetical protein